MMLPFDLPPPVGYSVSPKWDGQNFVFGDQITPVLEYSENFAGWSDDLTALHEEAAGESHPIDRASRNDAVAQVKKLMPSAHVVIMLNVLEHIEDDVVALQKAFNLLKPGGALVIEVPAGPNLYDAYDAELHHFRRYSTSELHNKLTKVGFIVRRKSHLGFVLFPAFAAVKLLNKWSPFRKNKAVVRKQAASTSGNSLVKLALEFESKRLPNFQLPF